MNESLSRYGRVRSAAVALFIAAGLVARSAEAAGVASPENTSDALWKAHVLPLFSQHCFKCHGELKQKNGLDLSTPDSVLKGGESGPGIVPGHPEQSLVFKFVQPDAEQHMPPKNDQLSEDELAVLRMWIASMASTVSSGTNGLGAATATKSASSPLWKESDYALGTPNIPRLVPPTGATLSEGIDWYVEQAWPRLANTGGATNAARKALKPSALADDRTFVRRIYLDLLGRIPKGEEAEGFVKLRSRDKRTQLVDRLLKDAEHSRYFAEVFDVVLMGGRSGDGPWRNYLEWAFQTNRPWSQMVRDILVARPSSPKERGAVQFLFERKDNYQAMAEAVAPALFGLQLQCAQCHNHPLAPEIKQAHYWALVAFLNRSRNVDTSEGPAMAESAIGGFIRFANLKKESQDALLTFLTGKTVPEKRPGENEKETDLAEKYSVAPVSGRKVATVPKFSRRNELAEVATRDNPLLARAFVNRMWALLLGRGLVHPVDRMDSAHPPSHPDLLLWLAREFERSNYDVQGLVRTIVLTRAYQRSSLPSGDDNVPPESFARGLEKPITGEALARSFVLAAGLKDETVPAGLKGSKGRVTFARQFPELFPTEYNGNLRQALFLTNNRLFDEALTPSTSGTVTRALTLKTPSAQCREVFLSVLGREPDRAERREGEAFLRAHREYPEKGVKELVWALLSGAEFRFNH